MTTSTLLTADELAGRLSVQPETIRKWSRTGRIPRVELSRKVIRYNLADVLATLESARPNGGNSDGE